MNVDNKVEYAQGFNAGMNDAVTRFSFIITLLFISYVLKVVLDHPRVQEYVNGLTRFELAETISYSADVLAFFIVMFMFLVTQGVNVYMI